MKGCWSLKRRVEFQEENSFQSEIQFTHSHIQMRILKSRRGAFPALVSSFPAGKLPPRTLQLVVDYQHSSKFLRWSCLRRLRRRCCSRICHPRANPPNYELCSNNKQVKGPLSCGEGGGSQRREVANFRDKGDVYQFGVCLFTCGFYLRLPRQVFCLA